MMQTSAPQPFLCALARDRRGAVGLYFAIVLSAMALLSVAALDLIRAQLVRARVMTSIDSAILAAGGSLGRDNWENVGVAFFNANMINTIGEKVELKTTDFQTVNTDLGINTVSLTVSTTIPMMAAGFLDISSLTVKGTAVAERQSKTAELVMVLDNTGSMRSNNNIGALRADAQLLVSTLAGGKTAGNLSNVTIGIVPYAASVNPGAETSTYAGGHTFNPAGGLNWKGCLIEPTGTYVDESDYKVKPLALTDAPGTVGWRQYYAPNADDNDYTPGNASTVKDAAGYQNASTGPNVGCPTPITDMTRDIVTLNTALGNMDAWHRGGTMSDIGLAWGLRLLSPAAPFQNPKPFGVNANKILVMMTDGDANYFKLTGSDGANKENKDVISDYGGYGRVDQYGLLGLTAYDTEAEAKKLNDDGEQKARGEATAVINGRITGLCNTLRANNVRVYTITFGTVPSNAKSIYQNCAYTKDYYFDAPSQEALRNAFKTIAGDLTQLRIIQ